MVRLSLKIVRKACIAGRSQYASVCIVPPGDDTYSLRIVADDNTISPLTTIHDGAKDGRLE